MNRIQEIDALRGIALFGILIVNIFVFHAPISFYGEFYGSFEGIQSTAINFVVEFTGGKFLFIFAFLFGYGMVLQQKSKSKNFNSYFTKRMLVLFGFGLIHILFFWFGDILASYALLGIIAMPLLKLSDKSILLLGILCILFRPVYYLGVVLCSWPAISMSKPVSLDEFILIFQDGSYLEILKLRMKEFFAFIPENLVWYLPKTLGVFFIGIFSARKNFFTRLNSKKTPYLSWAIFFLLINILWIYNKMDLFNSFDLEAEPIWRPILIALVVIFETFLGMCYIIGFTILFQKFHFFTQVLAKTGRLALSNYILQSICCVSIFYGYGLGYYGKLKPTDLLLISTMIFSLNVLFSSLYLRIKNYGPLEYFWRWLIRKLS